MYDSTRTCSRARQSVALCLALVALISLATGPAWAGVTDSPLPMLDGEQSKHLFTIPGTVTSAVIATAVTCTSLEKVKDIKWSVEFFDSVGTLVGAVLTFPPGPGQTATLSSAGTTLGDVDVGVPDSNARGSARVVATGNKLACSALLLPVQADGAEPAFVSPLPVIKKTTQKGD